MTTTTRVIAAALLLLSTSCGRNVQAESEPAPTAVDPVGMYDFVATLGAESRTGTLEIRRNDTGGLRGEAWLEGEPDPAIIESGAVTGNHVALYAFVGGGNQITFELDFTGAAFAGTITAGDETIAVTGTRRAR